MASRKIMWFLFEIYDQDPIEVNDKDGSWKKKDIELSTVPPPAKRERSMKME